MNKKIPIKSLSEQVASRVNIEVSDAQGAIKSIFSLIAEVLKEGKSVTINGLGTFSPDVNPLEPVAFIPDAELAEELNAPFSMFEPERLSDSVSEADLNQVGIQESTTDNTDSTLKVEIQSAQTQETEKISLQEPVKYNTGWASVLAEKISEKESGAEPVTPLIVKEEEEPPQIIPLTNEPIETSPVSDGRHTSQKSEVVEDSKVAVTVAETSTAPAPPIPVSSRPALEVPEWPEEEAGIEEERPRHRDSDHNEENSRFKSGFFWGLIVGLLIGALILFGYAMYFSTTV